MPKLNLELSNKDRDALNEMARQNGCMYNLEPSITGLLRRIASGELKLIPAHQCLPKTPASPPPPQPRPMLSALCATPSPRRNFG